MDVQEVDVETESTSFIFSMRFLQGIHCTQKQCLAAVCVLEVND